MQPAKNNIVLLLVCATLILGPQSSAMAQDHEGGLWGAPVNQERGRYARAMKEANAAGLMAVQAPTSRDITALARLAIGFYEAAARENPNAAEPHYRAAILSTKTLTRPNVPHKPDIDLAIAHLVAFERLAPLDPRLASALFQRSLLRTKRGDARSIALGIRDYDKELQLADTSSSVTGSDLGVILSNRAELLMMLGRLEEAIEGYRDSLAVEDDINYGYGLGVALDRDGQKLRAREVMRKYALRDRVNALHRSGTFFVPAGEIFYYLALRSESLGRVAEAQVGYREYLRRVPLARYTGRARENLEALRIEQHRQQGRRRSHP